MAMNGNEGGSAYPPNPDVKSGSCLIAGFQPLTVVHPTYWNAYKTESGATFSIDMVRLKLSFINGRGEWLSTHAQTFDCDSMSAWTSKIRPGGWYELWSFDLGDSSVALGIGFMEPSCKVNMNRGFIEFNPNKVAGDKRFWRLLEKLAPCIFEKVSKPWGLERGEKDTGRTHKDAAQMRRDAEREIKELDKRKECLRQEVEEMEAATPSLPEGVRTLWKARNDGSREEELGSAIEGLRGRISDL